MTRAKLKWIRDVLATSERFVAFSGTTKYEIAVTGKRSYRLTVTRPRPSHGATVEVVGFFSNLTVAKALAEAERRA